MNDWIEKDSATTGAVIGDDDLHVVRAGRQT